MMRLSIAAVFINLMLAIFNADRGDPGMALVCVCFATIAWLMMPRRAQ